MQYEGYYITKHVQNRFRERFKDIYVPKNKDFNWEYRQHISSAIVEILQKSHIDNSYLNNSRFMLQVWEKHGFDRKYTFFVNQEYNVVFVAVDDNRTSEKILVTCMHLDWVDFVRKDKPKYKSRKTTNLCMC